MVIPGKGAGTENCGASEGQLIAVIMCGVPGVCRALDYF